MNRFTCPKCKGHAWGTYGHWLADKTKWEGHCNGFIGNMDIGYERCRFKWPRTDDEKYGLEPFSISVERSK